MKIAWVRFKKQRGHVLVFGNCIHLLHSPHMDELVPTVIDYGSDFSVVINQDQ